MQFFSVQLCWQGRGQNARARMAERGVEQAGQGQVLLRVLHSSHLQQVDSPLIAISLLADKKISAD